MPWITPKTDWSNTAVVDLVDGIIIGDRFSADEDYNQTHFGRSSDWHRIKGNIEYVAAFARHLYPKIQLDNIPEINYTIKCIDNADSIAKTGNPAFPTPEVVNTVENGLQKLMDMTADLGTWEQSVPRRPNQPSWNYADLNRIERMTLALLELLEKQSPARPVIPFILGGGDLGTFMA